MADEHIPHKVSEDFAAGILIEILYEKNLINEATVKAIKEKLQQKQIAHLTKSNDSDTILEKRRNSL